MIKQISHVTFIPIITTALFSCADLQRNAQHETTKSSINYSDKLLEANEAKARREYFITHNDNQSAVKEDSTLKRLNAASDNAQHSYEKSNKTENLIDAIPK